MNKREMSAALSADYQAWLAGVEHRSALFDEQPKQKTPIPVTKKPVIKNVVKKSPKPKKRPTKLKVYKRPPPEKSILDAVKAYLNQPRLKTDLVDHVSRELCVNRRSVFNAIKSGFFFKRARIPAKTATLVFTEEIPESFVRRFEISAYKAHFEKIFEIGEGTISHFSKKLDRNNSQVMEQLDLLVSVGAMTKDGGIYREQI